jgi:hypothetical protein
MILPVVLYGYETWSFILMEKHRLKVSENRMLRRIFQPKKREEVAGGWRKLHDEGFIIVLPINIARVLK